MYISVCRLFVVVVLNVLGVGLLMVSQNASAIVRSVATGRAVLSEDSLAAESFAKLTVPIHQNFYFFKLLNEDAVMSGATPVVQERGPYVFRVESKKVASWENDRFTYEENKTYHFDATKSKEYKLGDLITTIDPETVLGPDSARRETKFITKSVEELLFKGYEAVDTSTKPGYFTGTNGTSGGIFEAYTGRGSLQNLNRIISYNGETSLECEDFRGTNGERYPPYSIPPPKLTFFNPTLCRPWDLHQKETVDINGLECFRYTNGRDFFSQTFDEELDKCLERGNNEEDVGIRGIFSSRSCTNNSTPILYSLPHFFNADPALQEHVTGLQPSEDKHNFRLDLYPALGVVVDIRIRVQVNYRLKAGKQKRNKKYDADARNIKEVIYPVYWYETLLLTEDSAELASQVKSKAVFPENALFLSTLVLGGFLAILGEIFLLSGLCARNWADDTVDDLFVTYNSGSDRGHLNIR